MEQQKVKFGVFGTWRGTAYIKAIQAIEEAEVVAILDKDPKMIEAAKRFCPPDVKVCKDFDELLNSGIDAVVLTNYFNEHAPYAIKAAKAGIHVFTETQAAITMKECVELVEAVEESGITFALAENYPFFRANMEIEKIYQSGQIGEVVFAEGEYIHPMNAEEDHLYNGNRDHWRYQTPYTFYVTHALAPLMKITNLMPKKVICKIAAGWDYNQYVGRPEYGDSYGIHLVEMENHSVFRVGAAGQFGAHENWYRIGGTRGSVESLRGGDDKVRLKIPGWHLTDANRQFGTECVYTPELTEIGKKALHSGHSGGDYWVTWSFVQDILNKREPYMNVYRAAALAAVGILGWQSALNDCKQLTIPDFTNKEEREAARANDLTPYDTDGKPASLPQHLFMAE